MQHQDKLVVFTGDLGYNVRRNIVDLDALVPNLTWLVLVACPRKSIRDIFNSQRRNLRKHGWRWIPYQVGNLLDLFRSPSIRDVSTGPGSEYTSERIESKNNVQIVRVNDIHAASSCDIVRRFEPDLGLSLASPILKSSLFELPRLGTLNLHKGRLPDFRGMPPAFWELWFNQTSVGCSVHWVNGKLDEGDVLAQSEVRRSRFSTVRGLQLQLDELGSSMVCALVKRVLNDESEATPQVVGEGRSYLKPTLLQQAELAARLKDKEPVSQTQSGLKNAWCRIIFFMHCSLLWRLKKPRVTVLIYHRVSDETRDNLITGIAQFERQMRMLSEKCDIIPIEEVLEMRAIQRSARPQVAVTFDDGYLDNYLHAVPSLRRYSVPASFFVSTGIVDTDRRFPHDEQWVGPSIPVLSWAQLREMRAWGFTIGSHTVNHIDCVIEDHVCVERELMQSHADLTRELGSTPLIFAYPYGGQHQMSPQRLQYVQKAAYVGCLSAYGGSNSSCINRWSVLRRGIHWEFSDAAFLYQCLGD